MLPEAPTLSPAAPSAAAPGPGDRSAQFARRMRERLALRLSHDAVVLLEALNAGCVPPAGPRGA